VVGIQHAKGITQEDKRDDYRMVLTTTQYNGRKEEDFTTHFATPPLPPGGCRQTGNTIITVNFS
jgi:hypothetical protein